VPPSTGRDEQKATTSSLRRSQRPTCFFMTGPPGPDRRPLPCITLTQREPCESASRRNSARASCASFELRPCRSTSPSILSRPRRSFRNKTCEMPSRRNSNSSPVSMSAGSISPDMLSVRTVSSSSRRNRATGRGLGAAGSILSFFSRRTLPTVRRNRSSSSSVIGCYRLAWYSYCQLCGMLSST
jgi:hypothetical protein